MRLRTVDHAGRLALAAWDDPRSRWLPLPAALEIRPHEALADVTDAVDFLAGDDAAQEATRQVADAVRDEKFEVALSAHLPFRPTLLRAFANWEQHWVQSARGLARSYLPAAAAPIAAAERVTRRLVALTQCDVLQASRQPAAGRVRGSA